MELAELDKEFNQRVQEKQNWYNGGFARDVQSNLTPPEVFGFIEEQDAAQQEASFIGNLGTALGNGVKAGARGLVGLVRAARDINIKEHQKDDPNYKPIEGGEEFLNSVQDSLQASEIHADSAAGQLGYAVVEGAVQYATQAAVTALTGGWGGAAYMGATIAGDQYLELRKEGVDAERAAQAATINAALQAPLEKFGFNKILRSLPPGSPLKKKLADITVNFLQEGTTEALQSLPEQLTNYWAKDKNATALSVAREWDRDVETNLQEAGFSGLVGGILGGSAAATRVIVDSFRKPLARRINEAHKNILSKQIDIINKYKANPEYVAAYIDANNQGQTVTVQAKDVSGWFQESNNIELAEALGVTEEEVNRAAEQGQDIDISRGNFLDVAAKDKGFFQRVEKGLICDADGELSVNGEEVAKILEEDTRVTNEKLGKLHTELDAVIKSATDAGMNKQHANNLRFLLEARALLVDPDNPAEYLQKNKLRFQSGEAPKPLKSGWRQTAFAYNFSSMKAFKDEIARTPRERINKLSYKYHGKNGGRYEIFGSNFGHIDKNAHPLTDEQWDDVLSKLDSADNIELTKIADKPGRNGGIVVGQIVNGDLGKYGILLEVMKNGRVFVTTSGMDGTPNMNVENWIKNIRGSQTLQHEAIKLNTGKMGQTSYIKMIQQKLGVVKNWYRQQDAMTDKGMISPMEDGSYIITLFKGADASTVIHETGHYFVDTMINEAIADPSNKSLVRDAKILLEYGGMTMEQWQNASVDERRAAHEKLAEGFETYIMEGKAPSAGLRGVFQRFSKWLTAIYSKIARSENAAELTDEVRGVFDRMLASQEEIDAAAKLNGLFNELPILNKLPAAMQNALQEKIAKAHDKAVDILTKEMMKDFNAKRKVEKAAYIKDITPKAEEFIHRDPVNQARELVGEYFGKDQFKNNPRFREVDGMAHANKPSWVLRKANASTIARKYRHAIGSVLPNYNEVLQDTKAAIDDRLNPIIEELNSGVDEYFSALAEETDTRVNGTPGRWELRGEKNLFSTYAADAQMESGRVDPTWMEQQYQENGKWTRDALARAEADGYVFVPASASLGKTNWYANYVDSLDAKHQFYVNKYRQRPAKYLLREIAEDVYRGQNRYEILSEEEAQYGSTERDQYYKEQAKELDDLRAKVKYLEENPEGVDLVEMSKRSALSDEQRVLFETIAEEVGYSSGDEMAQDILSKPSERQMVRNFINEAVQVHFKDIYKDRELAEEKAREALYNDETGELIALEQQLIQGYIEEATGIGTNRQERQQRAKVMAQKVKVYAENELRGMTMKDITKGNGRKFLMAERRAAATAQKALADGDLNTANYAKQQQLINHELYRRSLEIRSKMKNAKRLISKTANMKKENFGTQQHFNQMGALLERLGIKREGYDKNSNTQSLQEYIVEMKGKYGEIVDIPEFVMNPMSDLSNPDALTLEQFEDVVNAIKNLLAIARQDTKMARIDKENSFDSTKAEILAHLAKLNDVYTPRLGGDRKKGFIKGFADRIKDYRNVLRNADNFYLAMDNWTDGYFTKNWYDTINHCADAEATMTWEYQDKLANALKQWEPDEATAKAHDADVYYEELGTSTDKNTLVTMLCNLGNEGNKNRLCGTPPVAAENSKLWVKESALVSKEQAIEMTHQNLVEFLSKYLTKADVEYAQARIDAANAYYPQIRDLNIRTKGFAPPAVEATPMTMKLADGSVVYFKGGYFPLVRDSRKGSAPSGQNRLSATDEYPGAGISTMRTDAASSKGRIGGNYPVKLDRGCEITSIINTIHDICYREAMMDFRKILNDAEIFAELKTKLGEQNVRLLREQLETCANPYSNKQAAQAEELLSKTADALRRTATNGAIMLNLKTAAQNFSNILLYGNSVEGFTHADAFRAMSRAFTGQGRADVDAICRKSAFMRERMETPDVALSDIKNRKDLNPVERNTLKYGARLLGYTDMLTAKPVFAEAYMKKINEGASEQAAIDFANRVVRRTLGSSRMQDVSSLQRGSRLFRLFTMFQGFFNTQFNQWDREYHIMRNLWNDGEKKEMIERLIAFVSAKFLGACLMNVAIAELSLTAPFEKDKDGYRKISKELLNYPISMGGPIGQFSNVALQNLLGMRNYGYRLTATQGLLDKGLTAARRTGDVVRGEKEASALFEPTAYTIGAAFGVPGSVFNLIFNGYDIYDGTMEFELADIMSRRPKNERKPEEQLEKEKEKY